MFLRFFKREEENTAAQEKEITAAEGWFSMKNIWFTGEFTFGKFYWLDALTSPALCDRGDACSSLEVPGLTLVWCLVVMAVLVPIAVEESIDRMNRYRQCREHVDEVCVPVSPWFFDFGHWVLCWMFIYFAARFALILTYSRIEGVERRMVVGPPHILAKIAWFAHVNGIPGTIVASIMYFCFTRSGELHGPLTDASYALNAIFAVLDVWFFRMVLMYQHVVWIMASGLVYAVLMLPRNYHNPLELLVGCLLLIVVYVTIADFSMMRDTFYRHHVLIKTRQKTRTTTTSSATAAATTTSTAAAAAAADFV